MATWFFFPPVRVQEQSGLNTFEKEFKTTCSNVTHSFTLRESDISNVKFIVATARYSYILSGNAHKSDSMCVYFPISHDLTLNVRAGTSLVAQLVKNLPAMQKTPIQFLGQEDPLEKG